MRSTVYPCLFSVFFAANVALTMVSAQAAPAPARALPSELQGDFDPANPPGRLRVLVALDASAFFYRDGRPHGVEYAMLLDLEKYLNRTRPPTSHIRLQFIPMSAGELLPALAKGHGDFAVGLLPAIEAAKTLVDFTLPYAQEQWCLVSRDLPVTDPGSREIAVPRGGIAAHLLAQENSARMKAGEPIWITGEREATSETLFARIQSGRDEIALAGRYRIALWQKTTPDLRAGNCLASRVPLAWAVRKDAPVLREQLNQFLLAHPRLAQRAAELTRRHLRADGRLLNQASMNGAEKLAFFAPVFRMVGEVYEIDWLLLAAIGQQETTLRHVVSKDGPTGVMQVNPATARWMGIHDPHDTEQNITAAARYLHYLRERYRHPTIAAEDQFAFMLAAYNAGEGRLQQIRRQAAQEGLDPNRWEGQVERVARRMVGSRLSYYVGAVGRYYRDFRKADTQRLLPLPTPSTASAVAFNPADPY